jgi:hypothetical protein
MTVLVEGPAVRELGRLFLDGFRLATGDTRPLPDEEAALEGGVPVRVAALPRVQHRAHGPGACMELTLSRVPC